MLEIIILYFLTKKIGLLAASKGLKPGPWKIRLVLFWIVGEFAGAAAGIAFFGQDNLFSWILVAIAFAATSYFILNGYLSKLPDQVNEDDIHNLGR